MHAYPRYLPRYPISDMKTPIRYDPDIRYLESCKEYIFLNLWEHLFVLRNTISFSPKENPCVSTLDEDKLILTQRETPTNKLDSPTNVGHKLSNYKTVFQIGIFPK